MINEKYKARLGAKNVIRVLSEYATARGEEIGYENVFDFSLGNPSVPVPDEYNRAVVELHETKDSMYLHGYSPSLGNTSVREAVAKSLKERFGLPYETKHIFMTSGAAGAIAHAVRATTKPGDEVLIFAPYFSEYVPYVEDTGAVLSVVEADTAHFQINWDSLEQKMNPNVAAVLINSPNNPSGSVYSEDTLKQLSQFLSDKQKEYGHEIFLISDEPYREIVFDGESAPYPSHYYDNTLSCYSFSKGISLPGERIGYIAVNPTAIDSDILAVMFGQISRGIGHNCPSSSVQLAVAKVLDKTSDFSVYQKNRDLLYDCFRELGVEVEKPKGTFYIFPKAPGGDAVEFCMKAKEKDLIFVPSNGFGVEGFFRIAFCVDTEKVRRAIPVIEEFIAGQVNV